MATIAVALRIGAVLVLGSAFLEARQGAVVRWTDVLNQKAEWFASDDARRIADRVLEHQRGDGGWPKNTDMTMPPDTAVLDAARKRPDSTIDNGATVTEMRFLARVYGRSRVPRYRDALLKGLDYLLEAQYANGGWPQFFPLRTDYSRYITFNDNAMINVVTLLSEVASGSSDWTSVDPPRRVRSRAAVEKAVEVILRAQIRVDGRLTAWCAQHDEVTLEPRKARAYEHPSLSGQETVGIVRFLMARNKPDERVVDAIEAAVAWLKSVQIKGLRLEQRQDPSLPEGRDVVAVQDPTASPLWARFYEIGTNRPIFSGRDGVIRYSLGEIEHERRIGYAWLGTWPGRLLDSDYPSWKKNRYSHSLRSRLTRKAQKNQARAEGAERADTFSSPALGDLLARREARLARRRPWPAFKDTLELRTQTLRDRVALVFSIPVCPSPRDARSGQPGFFSASSASSARDLLFRLRCAITLCDLRVRAQWRTRTGYETGCNH